ncbi:acyl-CoA N-acyltransferase [Gorgonomyces haynaldii]|nr:acyl-CoA N-acyltransferase [Gorgonomyces haynaldii]
MSSAYGQIQKPKQRAELPLPIKGTLKNGQHYQIVRAGPEHLDQCFAIFNSVVEEGNTYPQEFQLNLEQFKQYFLSADAFVLITDSVMGAFYVKPNFPGRCAHICNGGFIVRDDCRNVGVGKALGTAYLQVCPLLGYKASMFNLVFVTNGPSVRLWDSLGFKRIGVLPKAGRLKSHAELVDAIMFHYDFQSR